MNDTPKTRKRGIGIALILIALAVGVLWYFTRDPTLEPITFLLSTAGALLVI